MISSKMKNSFIQRRENLKAFEVVKEEIKDFSTKKESLDLKEEQLGLKVKELERENSALDKNFNLEIHNLEKEKIGEKARIEEALVSSRGTRTRLLDELKEVLDSTNRLREENLEDEGVIKGLLDELDHLDEMKLDIQKKCADIDLERKGLHDKIDEGEAEIDQLNQMNGEYSKDVDDLEKEIESLKTKIRERGKMRELYRKKNVRIRNRLGNMEKEHVNAVSILESLESQIQEMDDKIIMKAKELDSHSEKLRHMKKKEEVLERMLKTKEFNITQMKMESDELSGEVVALKKHLVIDEKNLVNKEELQKKEEKKIEKLEEMLRKKKDGLLQGSEKLLEFERMIKKLDNQINGVHIEIRKLGVESEKVKKQQERYAEVASVGHTRFYEKIEELKLKNFMVGDLQRVNSEMAQRLKDEQAAYEGVHKERNLHGKRLLEMKEEILVCANKHKGLVHQIKQLSEEVSTKNIFSIRETRKSDSIKNENIELDNKFLSLENKIDSLEKTIKYNEVEIDKLKVLLVKAEEEKKKKLKEQSLIMNERDILGRQIIRRKQDTNRALKNIKILQYYIRNSENHFLDMKKDVEAFKEQMAGINADVRKKQLETQGCKVIREEVEKIAKECIIMKNRNALLQEEITNVVNVHQWREIEATNPEKFALIDKLQSLQKKKIKKYYQLEQKKKLQKEKEARYLQLKKFLKRGIGEKGLKELGKLRAALCQKQKDFAQVLENLKHAKEQVEKLEREITNVDTEIHMHRRNYFSFRSKQIKLDSNPGSSLPVAEN